MSLFAEYKKEREGKETIEKEYGFLTYLTKDGFLYIEDIYIRPDFRLQGFGKKLTDEAVYIAKKYHGCNKLLGTIDAKDESAHDSLMALIAYGLKIQNNDGRLLWFVKDI